MLLSKKTHQLTPLELSILFLIVWILARDVQSKITEIL